MGRRIKPKTPNMASSGESFCEVLPKHGFLHEESVRGPVLCKPKLMPLKSITLAKLEKMQKDAQEAIRQQEAEERATATSDAPVPPDADVN